MTDLDDLNLRKRVEISDDSMPDMDLIRDLWRAVQDARAEANAWKHANAFEPVTAEQLDYCMHDNWKEDRSLADSIIRILGPLYRQRKP
jgi:hypothetical protein